MVAMRVEWLDSGSADSSCGLGSLWSSDLSPLSLDTKGLLSVCVWSQLSDSFHPVGNRTHCACTASRSSHLQALLEWLDLLLGSLLVEQM